MLISSQIEGVTITPRWYFDEALVLGMPPIKRPKQFFGKSSWIMLGKRNDREISGKKPDNLGEEEMLWKLTERLSLCPPDGDMSPYEKTMALAVSEREGMRADEITFELSEKVFYPASFTEAMHYFAKVAGQNVSLGKVFHLRTHLRDVKNVDEWIVETIGLNHVKAKFFTPAKPFAAGSQFVVIKKEKKKK